MRHGWSLQPETWAKLPKRALKWRTVRLTLNDRKGVPNVPGVYVVCASPPEHTRASGRTLNLLRLVYTPLYVGQARDLQSRFVQHCSNPKLEIGQSQACFQGRLDFWFVRVEVGHIDEFEAALIDCFGPPANRISGITARISRAVPA